MDKSLLPKIRLELVVNNCKFYALFFLCSVVLGCGYLTRDARLKVVLSVGSIVPMTTLYSVTKELEQKHYLYNDLQTTSRADQQKKMLNPPKSDNTAEYDFREMLSDIDKNPTVFIIGEQGSGKTLLASYLMALDESATNLLLSPHHQAHEYSAATKLVTPKTVEVPYGEAAAKTLKSLMGLVEKRKEQEPPFGRVNVWVDEAVAQLQIIKPKTLYKQFGTMSLTEFRKYGLRAVFLTQADTVQKLGFEGMSSLMGSYRFIRLGKVAYNFAKSKGLPSGVLDKLEKDSYRYCLVDQQLVLRPSLQVMELTLELNALKRQRYG